MPNHATYILPKNASAVKPRERALLFERYIQFCGEHDPDECQYPIAHRTLKAFCRAIGIGRKSRKARKQRQTIRDVLSRPARILAGASTKAGPPKGPADASGRREYHTLDACRRGGIKSGVVRRHQNQRRNDSIREMVFKKGLTRRETADAHGVSLRTVYYVLRHRTFARAPNQVRTQPYQEAATNILRQAGRDADRGAGVTPPAPPRFARAAIALKMFWRQASRRILQQTPDPRQTAIQKRNISRLDREIARYKAAIRRVDPDRAQRVIDASRAWLNTLMAAFDDPLPILLRHHQMTRARQPPRRRPTTSTKPKQKDRRP